MRLEVLITKYLDGELTAVEDRELRQLLSESSEAKNAFDLSISLHYALRKDAHLTVPSPQLVRETEERVLMSILNRPAPPQPKKEKRFFALFSTGSAVLTGLVAVLLPLFTSTIGHEMLPVFRAETTGTPVQAVMTDDINEPQDADVSARQVHRTTRRAGGNGIAGRGRSGNGSSQFAASIPVTSVLTDGQSAGNETSLENGETSMYAFAEQSSGSRANSFQDGAIASLNAPTSTISSGPTSLAMRPGSASIIQTSIFPEGLFSTVSFGDRVHLTSTFGHDFLDGASGKAGDLSFFSQSLAYSMSDNENAGIELGYLWFTYGKPVVRFIPASSQAPNRGNEDPFGYDRKNAVQKIQGQSDASLEPDVEHPDGDYVTEIQTLPKQTWWGAAFYERTLYEKERISLQGRVGAGGSNDGALAYVRAVGLYRVLDNVSLSVGFDAKGMVLRTPYVTPKSHTVKTSFSFVYGFQLHL
jgi:hypothetical protein